MLSGKVELTQNIILIYGNLRRLRALRRQSGRQDSKRRSGLELFVDCPRAEGRPAVTIQGDGSPDKIMLLIEGLTRESARIGHPEGWQPPPLLESGEE
jgi:hypothetical protein